MTKPKFKRLTLEQRMRREAEMALLDRLYAEAAKPEWYPHQ